MRRIYAFADRCRQAGTGCSCARAQAPPATESPARVNLGSSRNRQRATMISNRSTGFIAAAAAFPFAALTLAACDAAVNPGDTNGQGVTAYAGAWYAVSSAGDMVMGSSSSGSGY